MITVGAGWAGPDPICVDHDALLQQALAEKGIAPQELDAGKRPRLVSLRYL